MRKSPFFLIVVLCFLVSCTSSTTKYENKLTDVNAREDNTSNLNENDYGVMNPDAPKQTKEFGQLVGLWECVSKDLVDNEDGIKTWYSNKASWKWEYILGGHAILNRWWQEDTSLNPISKEYFASGIFIFNPQTNLWEATIMNSRPHKLSPKFQALYKDGEITMHDGTGKWLVTFFDIKENSFEWKYEILTENNEWKPISKISAIRL